MTKAETFFMKLTEETPPAKAGQNVWCFMLKMPNGKAAAMFWKDCIVVKLYGEDFKQAMSLDGTQLFEPMEGRPI